MLLQDASLLVGEFPSNVPPALLARNDLEYPERVNVLGDPIRPGNQPGSPGGLFPGDPFLLFKKVGHVNRSAFFLGLLDGGFAGFIGNVAAQDVGRGNQLMASAVADEVHDQA